MQLHYLTIGVKLGRSSLVLAYAILAGPLLDAVSYILFQPR